jgi:hypothetical protein
VFCTDLPPRIYESLKTLGCLANARGPLQAHEIASATGLPPAQTAKILQSMTWAGFIESRRGARGGFWLVIPASRIRVTDVIEFFPHQPQSGSGHDRIRLFRRWRQPMRGTRGNTDISRWRTLRNWTDRNSPRAQADQGIPQQGFEGRRSQRRQTKKPSWKQVQADWRSGHGKQ